MASGNSSKYASAAFSISNFGLQNRDVAFALGVVIILATLFIPLPPLLLDFGLAISLTLSVLVLMVALWIPSPLQFNSFPTLLLVVTMLRLALNVSSTRLILSEGHTGPDAAGRVIQGFSNFIVSGDFIIGIVIFVILVIINFVVITKGSTRIAEVAARFSLDGMPGKQMSIDADLNAGTISDKEARKRRRVLEEESAFFGAMDGASKFVRGDAIAGLIITLVNIAGGILIGLISHNLTLGQAANNYTVLTIGDGLVSQIPALVVSLAAGLLVTKGSSQGAANEAILSQLSGFPKALFMAAILCFLIGLLPGFPFAVFALLAAGLAALGMKMRQEEIKTNERRTIEEKKPLSEEAVDPIAEALRLDDIRLSLGNGLVPLITSTEAALPGKVKSLRTLFSQEFGFVMPPVRIKDSAHLPAQAYSISLHGVETARGEVRPGLTMVILPSPDSSFSGERLREPTFGLEAVWVDEAQAAEAELRGFNVVDPESVIVTHLTEIIKEHMPDLLTYGATQELIEAQSKEYKELLSEVPNKTPGVVLQHVLQSLLAERVSIKNLSRIIEAVAEVTATTQNIQAIVEHVRTRLAQQICRSLADEKGYISVITLNESWSREMSAAISHQNGEESFIMSPQRVQEFVLAVRKEIQSFSVSDEWPALLVTPPVRPYVRSVLERVSPTTPVLSHNQVHRKALLRTVATVGD